MSLFEQYGMDIPLIFPSLNFLWTLHNKYDIVTERTWERIIRGVRPKKSVVRQYVENATDAAVPDPNDDIDE